jgi:hypothetical protein
MSHVHKVRFYPLLALAILIALGLACGESNTGRQVGEKVSPQLLLRQQYRCTA